MNGNVTQKAIRWDNFTGGLSGDKYYAPRNSYYCGLGIDTMLYKAKVCPENRQIYTLEDTSSSINSIYHNTLGHIISIKSDNKVFRNNTYLHTIASSGGYTRIVPMDINGTTYLYAFRDTLLSGTQTIVKLQEDGDYVSTINYTTTIGNPNYGVTSGIVILGEDDRVIFSRYNNLYIIDNTEIVTLVHTFPKNENIVGITNFQGQYSIYTNRNIWKDSTKYRWSGVSGDGFTLQRQIILNGGAIQSVVNDGPYDYAIVKELDNNDLFRFSGVQYSRINHNLIDPKILGNISGYIYLSGLTKDNKGVILKYGAKPGFNKALHTYSYIKSGTNNTLDIYYQITTYNNQFLYYTLDNVIYQGGAFSSGGFVDFEPGLVSNAFVGEDIRESKTLEQVFLRFAKTTINSQITLSAQIDNSDTWIELYTGYNGLEPEDTYGIKIVPDKFVNHLPRFHEIQFKIHFTINGKDRPEFMGLIAFYNNDVGY